MRYLPVLLLLSACEAQTTTDSSIADGTVIADGPVEIAFEEQDWDGDGDWELRAGDATDAYVQEHDWNGDGIADWRLTSYGPYLSRQEIDRGADGTIDEIIRGAYTPDGRLTAWEVDHGADGSWDLATYYVYDSTGVCSREFDGDGDGLPEQFGDCTEVTC